MWEKEELWEEGKAGWGGHLDVTQHRGPANLHQSTPPVNICISVVDLSSLFVYVALSLSLLSLFLPQVLRTHVMVRVGGGWDTLEHYLDKHDPCRCAAFGEVISYSLSGPCKTTSLMSHCCIIHRTFKIVNTRSRHGEGQEDQQIVFVIQNCVTTVCVLPLLTFFNSQ